MQLPTNMEKPTVIMLYLRAVLFLGTGQAVIFVRRNATFVVGRLADEPNLWRPLLYRRRRPLLRRRRRKLSTCLKKKTRSRSQQIRTSAKAERTGRSEGRDD